MRVEGRSRVLAAPLFSFSSNLGWTDPSKTPPPSKVTLVVSAATAPIHVFVKPATPSTPARSTCSKVWLDALWPNSLESSMGRMPIDCTNPILLTGTQVVPRISSTSCSVYGPLALPSATAS